MCPFCRQQTEHQPPTVAKRFVEFAGWALPGAALALMPKCPACVAAYVALATGLGISLSAASLVHTGIVILCMGLLLFAATRLAIRLAIRVAAAWRIRNLTH